MRDYEVLSMDPWSSDAEIVGAAQTVAQASRVTTEEAERLVRISLERGLELGRIVGGLSCVLPLLPYESRHLADLALRSHLEGMGGDRFRNWCGGRQNHLVAMSLVAGSILG